MGKHRQDLTNDDIEKRKIDMPVIDEKAFNTQMFEYLKNLQSNLNGRKLSPR